MASFRFPRPGASHYGYFDNETVIQSLFQIIYHRSGSFHTLDRPGPDKPYDYDSVYLGPGEPLGARSIYVWMAAVTPWLLTIGLLAWLFEVRPLAYGFWGLVSLTGTGSLVGYLTSISEGHKKPL